MVFLFNETKQQVILPVGRPEQTVIERQRVLMPFGGDAALGQAEAAGFLVRVVVAAEAVGRGDRLQLVRPRLDARKKAVVIVRSRHIRGERARRRLGIDDRALVVHETLTAEEERGLLARERTGERRLQETSAQFLRLRREDIPRGKQIISLGHLEHRVVAAPAAAFCRYFDPGLPRMLIKRGIRIPIESYRADGRRGHFDLIALDTVNDDGGAL